MTSTTVSCSEFSPGLSRENISFIHQDISMKPSAVVPQIWILLSLWNHYKRISESICVLKIVYRQQSTGIFYSYVLVFLKCMWVLLWLIKYNFKNHAVFVIYFISHQNFLFIYIMFWAILGLQESWMESTASSHTLFAFFSLSFPIISFLH